LSFSAEPTIQASFDIPVELHMPGRSNRVAAANIRRAGPSFYEVSCAESLDEGQRLILIQGARRIAVDVAAGPQPSAGVYKLTVVDDKYDGVRADRRAPVNLPATLHIAGEAKSIKVKVTDMSPAGMGIELAKALPLGARVCVNFEKGLAFGEVRFCQQKGADLYFMGFRLEEYIG